MSRLFGFAFLLLSGWCLQTHAQDSLFLESTPESRRGLLQAHERLSRGALRLGFYNLENLFDTKDDSLTRDDEFTPSGMKGWSDWRFNEKIANLGKTIIGLGGWDAPAMLGFCEVENKFVLERLLDQTGLERVDYQIIHEDSPDRRGIDVCMIYRADQVQIIRHKYHRIHYPADPSLRTRDILYVEAKLFEQDTIHVFFNHWPSRWGGQQASEPKRVFVASVIRQLSDSIFSLNPQANILITGDFNDEPGDKSLVETLKAKKPEDKLRSGDFVNLMYPAFEKGIGTEKYQAHWGLLDQWIVSQPLFLRQEGLVIDGGQARIFNAPWLVEKDEKYLGTKPFRTYAGPNYLGGYSDHFPVYIDLIRSN